MSDADERDDRLVRVLGRAGQGGVFLTEGWLFALGGALAVAGILLILIAWVGTSHTVLVAGQIPYVVSGGLLGVALVFLGGFLYFGHWLAVLVRENRERAEVAHQDALRIERALLAATSDTADGGSATADGGSATANGGSAGADGGSAGASRRRRRIAAAPIPARRLVRTPAGSMYHRPDCPTVIGRDDLTEVAGATNGYQPCGVCNPT